MDKNNTIPEVDSIFDAGQFEMECPCENKCGTILIIHEGGWIEIEDQGQCLSIEIPDWFLDAMVKAIKEHTK